MCPHKTAADEMADHIYELEETLKQLRTHPAIADTILHMLYDHGSSSFVSNLPEQHNMEDSNMYNILTQAAKEQVLI